MPHFYHPSSFCVHCLPQIEHRPSKKKKHQKSIKHTTCWWLTANQPSIMVSMHCLPSLATYKIQQTNLVILSLKKKNHNSLVKDVHILWIWNIQPKIKTPFDIKQSYVPLLHLVIILGYRSIQPRYQLVLGGYHYFWKFSLILYVYVFTYLRIIGYPN